MPDTSTQTRGWIERALQELAPSHGRYGGALRTAFAATIAAAILLVLQIPMIAPGLYLIFLVSYDVPYLTFRRSVIELVSQCLGVGASLMLIQASGNDPMARVLGIAAFTFLSAFLLNASTVRIAAMNLGIFPVLTFSLWEYHLQPKVLVYLSTAPIATGALAVGCKVAIEYLFTRRDPRRALQLEIAARMRALRTMFMLYSKEASSDQMKLSIAVVSRYAFAGQGKMLSLLKEAQLQSLSRGTEVAVHPTVIPFLARLLDHAASFGRQFPEGIDENWKLEATQIAGALSAMEAGRFDEVTDPNEVHKRAREPFGTISQTLYNLAAVSGPTRQHTTIDLPQEKKEPLFKPDAWTNREYVIYATKLSFCATLCYVIYNALAWQGISTATLTVLVAGLSTTGATNQKMLFRIVGALIGGVVFGIGCIVFVYPFADTLLPFLLSIACVSFIAAWIARSAHLGYIGLQIVFAFYLVVFQEYGIPLGRNGERTRIDMAHGFGAPTILTLGRDRLLGVLLALVVMWAIFHRLHPERTIEKMRRNLTRLLHVVADLLPLFGKAPADRIHALREEAESIVVETRGLAEAIPYELDQQVKRDLEVSEVIQNAISSTGSLLLHAATQNPEASGPLSSKPAYYDAIADELRRMAAMLDDPSAGFDTNATLPEPPGGVSETCSLLRQQCSQIRAAII